MISLKIFSLLKYFNQSINFIELMLSFNYYYTFHTILTFLKFRCSIILIGFNFTLVIYKLLFIKILNSNKLIRKSMRLLV